MDYLLAALIYSVYALIFCAVCDCLCERIMDCIEASRFYCEALVGRLTRVFLQRPRQGRDLPGDQRQPAQIQLASTQPEITGIEEP